MADALVSALLDQLVSITAREVEEEVRLVVGADKEVEKLTSNLKTIKAVLNDAEKKQARDEAVEVWLDKLNDTSYDMDDVLDEWNTELSKLQIAADIDNAPAPKKRKVSSFIPNFISDKFNKLARHDIAHRIKDLNSSLDDIAKERQMYGFELNRATEEIQRPKTTSLVDVSSIIGHDNEKFVLVNNLLGRGSQDQESSPHVISLVGMGGIGKTTLAQQAYNDDEVNAHFEIKMWVCVSNPFDQIKVAKAIIHEIERRDSTNNITELQTLLQIMGDLIGEKKFFLVLDDVWTEDKEEWEPFKLALKHGAKGSRILITTRNEKVAMITDSVQIFNLETLSDDDCWSIFSKLAFCDQKDVEQRKILEDVGRQMALKCKGLPLAAKTLGSLMRFKKTIEQWQDVLNNRLWELKESKKYLFAPLLLSYFDLPSPVKRCFTYCAMFPKDYEFCRNEIVELWMAQGYLHSKGKTKLEIIGLEYFEMLAMRSFFQDFRIGEDGSIIQCKMHDIVHDHAQLLLKNECFHMDMAVDETKELRTISSYKNICHLMLTFRNDWEQQMEVPAFEYKAKKLRTLFIRSFYKQNVVLLDLFHHLTSLRTLDLSSQSLKEVPKQVNWLIHLRYLNLSDNDKLEELPETLCDLYNLLILNVSSCSLTKLPQGIGKLRNLRHLILYGVYYLKPFPKGFGRLSYLVTLDQFVVGGNDDNGGCKLGELKMLNHISSDLFEIKGLDNLIEVCEAEDAQLKKKIHLRGLSLNFDGEGEENKRIKNDEVLLNALEPYPGLEFLKINQYHDTTMFRNWSMSIKLKKLNLFDFDKLECLPPLGRLPFLESLIIWGMKNVKKFGVEFLGKDERLPSSSSSSLVFFPNLKDLNIQNLQEWEEWDGLREEENDFGAPIMPCLHELVIQCCPKLKALPHFLQKTPLNILCVSYSPILEQRCERGTGEDWPKISHIPKIIMTDPF